MTTAQSPEDVCYAESAEAQDLYCLRPGEARQLLRNHPWRRFVVIGDSLAEGLGDPVPGYTNLGWGGRLAAELAAATPELTYLNLGRRDLRTAEVREQQLPAALAFGPDLALIGCGANDALAAGYAPSEVDKELSKMVVALRDQGAQVLTVGLMIIGQYPAVPRVLWSGIARRLRVLGTHTAAVSAVHQCLHCDLAEHPATADPGSLNSADGIHPNLRCHAIAAASVIRCVGDYLERNQRNQRDRRD